MTRRRWIADEVNGDRAALTGANAVHLARVLRAHKGQQFDISTGSRVHLATVTAVSDERVEFELGEEVAAAKIIPVTLALAIIKFDRFEWAIEKCTEIGVSCVLPLVARRTETHLAHAAEKRVERWRKIAREAAQQSRRMAPPEIAAPVRIQDVVARQAALRIVLNENESGSPLVQRLSSPGPPQAVDLAIGPEGGWTDDEISLFDSNGWVSASLGPTILRAETAAIAATAITVNLLS